MAKSTRLDRGWTPRSPPHPIKVVLDTNRRWTTKLPPIDTLWPDAEVIACVRNPA